MKRLLGILAMVSLFTMASFAGEIILGPGLNSGRAVFHQTTNLTLDASNTYILTGLYFVDSTHTLTIPAGTVIKGDSAATLIVYRGAQIFAQGTKDNPIVFTSLKRGGVRGRGDWGGVILLGKAPTNQPAPVIEGGIIPGSYGGSVPTDNSGIFEYVRIEFPGFRYALNNEVNGLTLGGVGSGTTVRNVQVSYSFDDSYEWFGGTVNVSKIVAFGGTDDEFDTDFGFQGKVQYAFGLRDPDMWDPTGQSNGFESDNMDPASDFAPRTMPYFSNVTLIGPYRVDSVAARSGNTFQYGAVLRRGTKESIYNSVIAGYPGGPSVRDNQTFFVPEDSLEVRNLSLSSSGTGGFANIHTQGGPALADVTSFLSTPAYSNLGIASQRTSIASVGLTNLNNLNDPNPVPAAGSELIGSASFANSRLGSPFESNTYRGAFNPDSTIDHQWTSGWTNFNPQYSTTDVEAGWNMVAVPTVPPNGDPNVVFPGQSGVAFAWNNAGGGSYGAATSVTAGAGYWVKYASKRTIAFGGRTIPGAVTVPATSAGWVLVGGVSYPVKTVTASGGGSIDGLQFRWDRATQGYVAVDLSASGSDDLAPGEGVWVKVTGACTLTLNQ